MLFKIGRKSNPSAPSRGERISSNPWRSLSPVPTGSASGGSGIDLRHQLKAKGVSVPVIFITANETPSIREAALRSGCVAFLTKPFSAHDLIEPLKQAAAGR
ncbi:response regulator [Bradyrhizobium cytisi]|uniref:response regulator n=1 Tax=Bradyrhizobium cytisi TaxID=515489 RepID=UPI001FE537AA|nr:response regulator [Bradyrhizobium cytisi]